MWEYFPNGKEWKASASPSTQSVHEKWIWALRHIILILVALNAADFECLCVFVSSTLSYPAFLWLSLRMNSCMHMWAYSILHSICICVYLLDVTGTCIHTHTLSCSENESSAAFRYNTCTVGVTECVGLYLCLCVSQRVCRCVVYSVCMQSLQHFRYLAFTLVVSKVLSIMKAILQNSPQTLHNIRYTLCSCLKWEQPNKCEYIALLNISGYLGHWECFMYYIPRQSFSPMGGLSAVGRSAG